MSEKETLSDKIEKMKKEIARHEGGYCSCTYNADCLLKIHLLEVELKGILEATKYYKSTIQEVQEALKKIGKKRLGHLPSKNYELFCEDIELVFKNKFGGKLVK